MEPSTSIFKGAGKPTIYTKRPKRYRRYLLGSLLIPVLIYGTFLLSGLESIL